MRSGRFEKSMAEAMERLNASIGFDRRFFREDVEGSRAWARGLRASGFLDDDECQRILEGLDRVESEIAAGELELSEELEDIHLNVEHRLTEIVGDAGAKLHTGRSRNDQVATDFRLWIGSTARSCAEGVERLQSALVGQAERSIDVVVPAYTHLQRAQPVLLAHHLLAYVEMFARDVERFRWAARQANVSPLGSGACAGNQFGIDREALATELGFDGVTHNSLDAVSDRDFACDFLYAATMFLVHLSRFSEDVILWSSSEFGWVRLDDSVTSGSSMLPQKKNADACELGRGKVGRVLGHLVGLATTIKGLPLSYNKDLQEDKEGVFDAADTISLLLPVFRVLVETLEVDRARAAAALEGGFLEAISVADYLTRRGVAFREAHHLAGLCVRRAEALSESLADLSLDEYRAVSERFGPDVHAEISIEGALADKDVVGGTAPGRVRAEIDRWKQYLKRAAE